MRGTRKSQALTNSPMPINNRLFLRPICSNRTTIDCAPTSLLIALPVNNKVSSAVSIRQLASLCFACSSGFSPYCKLDKSLAATGRHSIKLKL